EKGAHVTEKTSPYPPPTYEVPSILSTSHRESSVSQRDHSTLPTRKVPSRRDENCNRDNANNASSADVNNTGGDSGDNDFNKYCLTRRMSGSQSDSC
ncbi:14784_t:CDS:2, partial [Acaulospora morrowiae]